MLWFLLVLALLFFAHKLWYQGRFLRDLFTPPELPRVRGPSLRVLHIPIHCGWRTCAAPGEQPCEFLGLRTWSKREMCLLFHLDLEKEAGRVYRCEDCLKYERWGESLGARLLLEHRGT